MLWQADRFSHCGTVLPKHFASSNRNDIRDTRTALQQFSSYSEHFKKQTVPNLQNEWDFHEANQTDEAAEAE